MTRSILQTLETHIAPLLPAYSRILVGLSGGADSVVLLHLLQRLAPRFHWQISVLHVHHGISLQADSWATFCAQFCAQLNVPFQLEKVDIAPLRELGIEAAARKLRHAAFANHAVDFVALAHHADDQAETLLLQLLRGAGVRGASAMPLLSERSEGKSAIIRPLLSYSRADILHYAETENLQWIEDESNADTEYPRNFLRHRVLPELAQKFPACRHTLARSAHHFAEASALLDELAQQDAARAIVGETLALAPLQQLSRARGKNLLRYFLHRLGAPMPQTAQLDELLEQLCHARASAQVAMQYGDWQIHRYAGLVYAQPALGTFDAQLALNWQGETELTWPPLKRKLRFDRQTEGGISLAKLQQKPVTLRLRQGGEKLRPHTNAATRTLKNLLQEHAIPPWQRDRLPLLYSGEILVCVVGVAIAAEYQASKGELALQLKLE